jgi:hypothetical protein
MGRIGAAGGSAGHAGGLGLVEGWWSEWLVNWYVPGLYIGPRFLTRRLQLYSLISVDVASLRERHELYVRMCGPKRTMDQGRSPKTLNFQRVVDSAQTRRMQADFLMKMRRSDVGCGSACPVADLGQPPQVDDNRTLPRYASATRIATSN